MRRVRKGLYGFPVITVSPKEYLNKGAEVILKALEPVGKAVTKVVAALPSSGPTAMPYFPTTIEEVHRERENLKMREKVFEEDIAPALSPSNHVVAWTQGSMNPKVGQLKIAEWGPLALLGSLGVDAIGFKYVPKGVKATAKGTKAAVTKAVKNSKAKEVSKTIDKVVDEGFTPRLSSDKNLYRTTTDKEVSALKSGRFEVHPNGGNHGVYGWRRGEPFYQPGSMVESKMVGKRNGLSRVKDPTYLVAPVKEDLQVRIGSGGKYSEPVPATEVESGTHAYYHPSGGLAYDNSSIGFLPGDKLPNGIVAWSKKNGKWLFEPIEQPKQIYRARVYKGGNITDPYSNFVTTDRRYASQYGPTTSYIFESKNPAFAKEPMMGHRDPVSLDMFIYNNTKANPSANAIVGHDAVTGEFPYTSLGVEILNMNPKNLTRVRRTEPRTSLKFFERKPFNSKLKKSEEAGVPKGERNNRLHGQPLAPYYEYSLINKHYEPWTINEKGQFVFASPEESAKLGTIHFSMNEPVMDHFMGSWGDAPTVTIMPYRNMRSQTPPVDIAIMDTFFPNYKGLKVSSRGSKTLTGDKATYDYYKSKGIDVEFSPEMESLLNEMKDVRSKLDNFTEQEKYGYSPNKDAKALLDREYQLKEQIDEVSRKWARNHVKTIPNFEKLDEFGRAEGLDMDAYPYQLGSNGSMTSRASRELGLDYTWQSDPSNHSVFLQNPEYLLKQIEGGEYGKVRPEYIKYLKWAIKHKADYRVNPLEGFDGRTTLGDILGFDNAVTTFAPKAVAGPRLKVRPSVPNYISFNDMYAAVTKNLGRHLSKEEFAEIVKDLPMDFVSTGNGKGFTVFKMSPKEIDDFLIALARNITEKRPYHEPPEYLAKYAAQIINRPEIAVLKFPSTGIKKTTASPYAQRILDNTVFPRLQANRPWMKDVGKGFDYDNIYEIPDAYFLFAKKDAPASYSPKTGVIRVNDHRIIDANVPHELRHRADTAYPYTEFEQLITSKAFEGFENASHKPNYDMTVEIPTTILESRNFLLSKYLLDRWLDAPLEILNKIIAKAPGNAVFHAIENSNGYGARFIKYLRETGLLTPERAEAFRKALIYGSLSSPLIMQGINQFGMIDSKKKGGKTHKPSQRSVHRPWGHRSILDNGWQSTKLLKNKKNVYGK